MLNRDIVVEKMKERGFVQYATMSNNKIQFISKQMYDTTYYEITPKSKQMPIINVLIDLEKDEFSCWYNIKDSINTLNCPTCGPVLDDAHFDRIVCQFELHAKWLSKIEG